MSSIRLSKKHGVNPSLMLCLACSESSGVALVGALPGDAQAPYKMRDRQLCSKCEALVKDGAVLMVEVDPSRVSIPIRDIMQPEEAEPARTGRMWGIRGEAFDRLFNIPRPKRGVCFLEVEAAERIFGPDFEPIPT